MTSKKSTKENRGKAEAQNKRPYLKWIAGMVAIALLGAIVGYLVMIRGMIPDPIKAQQMSVPQAKSLGSQEARLTLVEYADFQCPFCGLFARNTKDELIDKYIKTGLVRLEYKHFPIVGEESLWAAHASECAAEQGRFWEYHDKLFKSQAGENQGAFSKSNLKGFAAEIGLQEESFNTCMDSGKYLEAIKSDFDAGSRLGARATPTFFLNGNKIIEGAQPFQAFETAINNELIKGVPGSGSTGG